MRPLAFIVGCSLAGLVLAAPVPKPKEWRFAPGLDRPIDPDKDCKFTLGKGALAIEVPGKPHDIDPARKRDNAPRVLRPVEGDLRIEVRVSGDFRISEASSVAGVAPGAGGGLLVMADERRGECLRLEFGMTRDQGRALRPYILLKDTVSGRAIHLTSNDPKGEGWAYPGQATKAFLKLELRHHKGGCRIRCFDSLDGKKWARWSATENSYYGGVPKKLKVGVAASSTSTRSCKLTFDRFKLTPLPPVPPSNKGEKK
jgi:hypothetical protein